MFKSILRTLFRTGTHAAATKKPLNGLAPFRVGPQFEMFEDRITPSTATFQDYGGWGVIAPAVSTGVILGTAVPGGTSSVPGAPAATQGIVVNQVLTPIDTNNDLSSFEEVTFKFTDVSGGGLTVSLLVFRKLDSSPPPPDTDPAIYKNSQTLVYHQSVNVQNGQSATLTVDLPACDYQVDATAVPLGTLDLSNPIGYTTALTNNLDGAIGANACPTVSPMSRGYWVNHVSEWPVDGLSLGTVMYTQEQLITILSTPVRGNGAIALAQQAIAAKLNLCAGADPSQAIMDAINQADLIFANNCLFTTSTSITYTSFSVATSTTSTLVSILGAWNSLG